MIAATPEAYRLMHYGTLALADIEANGIRIDVDYLQRAQGEVDQQIIELENELKQDEIWELWKRRFRDATNLGSRVQLGTVLFDILKIPPVKTTKTGRPSTDEDDLELIDHPFIEKYLRKEKLAKLSSTYIKGILREVDGDLLRPSFNLNLARTYRSACSDPNFQNIPVRNPEIAKWIRTAFIPRDGHWILELDYGQIEVRVAACYHQDPTMLEYIETNHDMHHDMARECFKLTKDQVTKKARFVAKNSFVFAEFYGSTYINVCQEMWRAIDREKLALPDGTPMKKHLALNGINELGRCNYRYPPLPGTFEYQIKKVENRFWNRTFPVYAQWKEKWWNKFIERGSFKTLTGFVVRGPCGRRDAINYPIQGSAFHCLLWSLITLNRYLKKHNFGTKIIGQIHDSMILDVPPNELEDILHIANHIMTVQIRKAWPWIITPLVIEAEGSQENWFLKKEIPVG